MGALAAAGCAWQHAMVGSARGWLGVVVAWLAAGRDGWCASIAGLSSWFQLIQVDEKFVHFFVFKFLLRCLVCLLFSFLW